MDPQHGASDDGGAHGPDVGPDATPSVERPHEAAHGAAREAVREADGGGPAEHGDPAAHGPRPTPPPAPHPGPVSPAAAPSRARNESVAAALRELDGVAARPLAEHPDAFARIHTGLQQALSEIDDA